MNLIKLPTFKDKEQHIIRCVVESPAGSPSQIIGVLEVLQREDGKTERNDRIFVTPVKSHREDDVNDVDDLSKRLRRELERFFLASAELEGKKLELLGWKGPKIAEKLIEDGCAAFARAQK